MIFLWFSNFPSGNLIGFDAYHHPRPTSEPRILAPAAGRTGPTGPSGHATWRQTADFVGPEK